MYTAGYVGIWPLYGPYTVVKQLNFELDFDSFELKLFLSRLMRSVGGSKTFTVAILTLYRKAIGLQKLPLTTFSICNDNRMIER